VSDGNRPGDDDYKQEVTAWVQSAFPNGNAARHDVHTPLDPPVTLETLYALGAYLSGNKQDHYDAGIEEGRDLANEELEAQIEDHEGTIETLHEQIERLEDQVARLEERLD
jgi:phage shock protein A